MRMLATMLHIHRNETVYKLLLLFLMISSIGSSQLSLVEMFRNWLRQRDSETITNDHQPESCEVRLNKVTTSIFEPTNFQPELNLLMKTYYNWGELLAPIPVAISILGQLILISNQRMDFPININPPKKGFKHIEYPESFRTTLLQISQRGNWAFMKAHTNMDLIKLYNRNVPRDVDAAVGFIMSKSSTVISLRLTSTLDNIKRAADRSKELSEEVVNQFQLALDLIQETILAVTATKNGKKKTFHEIRNKINTTKLAEQFSENEIELLKNKNTNIEKMLKNVGKRQQELYVKIRYPDCGQDRSSQSEPTEKTEATADRHHPELFFKAGNWHYKFEENRWNADDCLESNTQNLVQILTAAYQYELKCQTWQKDTSNNQDPSYLEISEELKQLSYTCETIRDCQTLNTISKACHRLVDVIKKADLQVLQKTDVCPGTDEMEEMAMLIADLRATQIQDVYEEKTMVLENVKDVKEAFLLVQQHQNNMINEIGKTAKKLMELNNKKMIENQFRMEDILKNLDGWNQASLTYQEAIKILEKGLFQLLELKYNWDKLTEFFKRIGSLTNKVTEASYSFIYFTSPLSLTTEKDEVFYDDLIHHAEEVNAASVLLADIASVYVTISDRYIMDRTTSLSRLLSLDVNVIGIEGIERERRILADSSLKAYKGIMKIMKEEEEQMLKKLQTKRKAIIDDYKNLKTECLPSQSTTLRPVTVQTSAGLSTIGPNTNVTIDDDVVIFEDSLLIDENEDMDESDW